MIGDLFDGSSAGDTGNAQGTPLNDGDYEGTLRLENVKLWKSSGKGHLCVKFTFSVLADVNGHSEGERVEYFDKLQGNPFPSYDAQALGRVRRLLGAIAGLSSVQDIDAKIKGTDLQAAASDAQPFTGTVLSCTVTSKTKGEARFVYPQFRPSKSLPNEVTQTKAVVPPPPVAAPAANRFTEANGFYPHTGMEPGHVYNAAGEIYHVATGKKVA